MTLIECFDRSVTKNVAGALQLRPEKLIFLGDIAQMRPVTERFLLVLAKRGIDPRLQLRQIPREGLDAIIAELTDIISPEDDYVIDISGGDERLLLAVGAVLSRLDNKKRQRVSLQKLEPISETAAALSVWELIRLHGGIIHPETEQPDTKYTPGDMQRLWTLVCGDPKNWNRKLALLNEFESRSDSKTRIFLDLRAIRGSIRNSQEKLPELRALLKAFEQHGVIRDYSDEHVLNYTYTSPLMRQCTLKAGNALETKVLLEARALQDQGRPFFNDCQMSVHIDWDGDISDPEYRIPETRNEIDLVLTRGLASLFISCKNGNIGDDELYKLHTVATLFGGPDAGKMLVATELDRKSPMADQAFIQRAQDMGIRIVTNAAKLSQKDWRQVFREVMG